VQPFLGYGDVSLNKKNFPGACVDDERACRDGGAAARRRRRWSRLVMLLALLVANAPLFAASYDIEVKKKQRVLLVKDGERVRATFPIALGRGGPGDKHKLGDNKTPVGTYRIVGVNDSTAFDTFLRLNYPNVKDAFYGLKSSLISRREFDRIVTALRHNQVPPQNTRLGGAIGIHGLGEETPEKVHIQNKLDWTQGCIALRNHDLHELREFIEVGTRVVISE
jgi:murein L,D-transpeptidase YafK